MKKIVKIKKKTLVETNRQIIEEWNKSHLDNPDAFGVRGDELDTILQIFENVGTEKNLKENLMIKSAYLMGAISWAQPFTGANKRTGLLVVGTFLDNNGYSLKIRGKDEPALRKALYDIQLRRSSLDSSIIAKLFLYISRGIKKA